MLKIFMSLVVGITSGMWIWSSKTVRMWKRWRRVEGRKWKKGINREVKEEYRKRINVKGKNK